MKFKASETKFRAYDKLNKLWIVGGFHVIGEVTIFGVIESYCKANLTPEFPTTLDRLSQIELMECSLLPDKNGNLIYEGDILAKTVTDYDSEDYDKWVISGFEGDGPTKKIYGKCDLSIFRFWIDIESFGYEGENLEDWGDWEIIGNLFDNPELLNQK